MNSERAVEDRNSKLGAQQRELDELRRAKGDVERKLAER